MVMTRPPDDPEPALAPAKRSLYPGALERTPAVTPSTSSAQTASSCVVLSDPSTFGPDWFSVAKTDLLGIEQLPRFRELLEDHNAGITAINIVRNEILRVATTEKNAMAAGSYDSQPTNLLKTIVQLNNSKSPTIRANDIVSYEALCTRLAALGHVDVFDPWDGWWAGEFSSKQGSSSKKYFNLHVWDQSIDVNEFGYIQRIQAVTQISASGSSGIWFASALHMEQHPDFVDRYDHAINAWSADDGITGFVKKNLGRDEKWLPHVGFLLDNNTLLWFAWERSPRALSENGSASVLMFAETGFANGTLSAHYEIRGARLTAQWQDGTFTINKKFFETGEHYGDYKAVMPLVDHDSLKCAKVSATLGDMDTTLAETILNKTRP
jgi:hypothetical protein